MIVSDFAVQKRVTVYVLTFVIVVAGLISYIQLPLESTPDVTYQHVFVTTFYPGVSPEDIEESITKEIEDQLKGLKNVKKVKSVSAEGISSIDIEFTTDTDIDQALTRVKDKVDLAKPKLPPDLDDDPVVSEVNFSELPILVLSMSGDVGMRRLTDIAEDLEDAIERIPGVLEVDLVGGAVREVHIEIFPERMAIYGIPFSAVQSIVGGENANVSGGSIRSKEGKYQLRVPGEFATVEEVESIVVGTVGGQRVYLRDIARVVEGLEDSSSYARTNGRDSVTLYVKKRSGENIVDIVSQIDSLVDKQRESWPHGITLTRASDRAKEIRMMVSDLENNIITGLILVVLVVMFAMGLRNALLVSISIPLSMLLTFVVLSLMGITLNMVVLFSLTLALGMLVDNAIVIVENIYRFMQQGVPRIEAAMRATSEVAWPIIGSSLTTIGAFFPMLFWTGLMGDFMSFLPLTVIITLSSCLFVSLVINPAIASALMKVDNNGKSVTADEIMEAGEHPMSSGGSRWLALYRAVLRGALRYRLGVLLFSSLVLVFMMLAWLYVMNMENFVEFFPKTDPKNAWIAVKSPQGADIDYTDGIVRQIAMRMYDKRLFDGVTRAEFEKKLDYNDCIHPQEMTKFSTGEKYQAYSHLPFVEFVYEKVTGTTAQSGFSMGGSDNQVSLQFLDLADRAKPDGTRGYSVDVIATIEDAIKDIPGAEITVEKEDEGPSTGKPINIELSGDDFETLGQMSDKVKDLVALVPYVRNVKSDYEKGSPTLEISVDRKIAGALGLTAHAIGFAIKSAINGTDVSTFRRDDDDYDIVVRFTEDERRNIATLRKLFIPTASGLVPLTTIADIKYTGGLGKITRINYKRVVTVTADIDDRYTTGDNARGKAEQLMKGVSRFSVGDITDYTTFAKKVLAGKSLVAADLKEKLSGSVLSQLELLSQSTGEKQNPKAQLSRGLKWFVVGLLVVGIIVWFAMRRWRAGCRWRAIVYLAGTVVFVILIASNVIGFDQESKAQLSVMQKLNDLLKGRESDDDPRRHLFEEKTLRSAGLNGEAAELLDRYDFLRDKEAERLDYLAIEQTFAGAVVKSPPVVVMPAGYDYEFTGENEEQTESMEFLLWAMLVALMIIFMVLVAMFNSIALPFVIMSAVALSLGGVLMGLAIYRMPFGTIMTGVGVISLAGVVVNNAIVLIDYIEQLVGRGMSRDEAIVAAGATRLRPVLLTAISTVLALIPMVTGVSYDFTKMEMQWVSESSQFWKSMAVAVIFGLSVATMLTLIVVPVLYSIVREGGAYLLGAPRFMRYRICYHWWNTFDRKHGTSYATKWRLGWWEAFERMESTDGAVLLMLLLFLTLFLFI